MGTTAPQKQRARPLGLNYAKLWCASAISNLGDGVRLTAMPLLAASITHDPALVAGVSLASSLPWLLFALPAGAIADRVDRRRLMSSVQVFRFVVMALLSIGVAADLGDVALLLLLYAVGFTLGIAETLFDNAAQSILPSLVPKSELQRANGRLYAVEVMANEFVGPPLGSFLFVVAAAVPFAFDSATFAIAAVLIAAIAGSYRPERDTAPSRLRSEIAEGVRWLWRQRLLRTLGLMTGAFNLVSFMNFSVFVLYALEILGLGEVGYGTMITAAALGGLIGSLVAVRVARVVGEGATLRLVIFAGVVGNLAIALLGNVGVVAIAFMSFGFGAFVWNVIAVSLRQEIVPDRLMGRVNSVYRLLAWGTMPIGAALGGAIASAFGLRAPYFVSAGLLAVTLVATLGIVNDRTIAAAREGATDGPTSSRS